FNGVKSSRGILPFSQKRAASGCRIAGEAVPAFSAGFGRCVRVRKPDQALYDLVQLGAGTGDDLARLASAGAYPGKKENQRHPATARRLDVRTNFDENIG